jgi:drug/metabolite transporter (DMT)-like permease
MTLAMGLFAVEDATIKALAATIPPGQIIWMLGAGGAVAFGAWLATTGQGWGNRSDWSARVLARAGAEALGSCLFVTALALIPLALASAFVQSAPLLVAAGAALFLGHRIGPRRWAAIAIGFGGVLLILRPGGDAFSPAALLALGGVACLAARDLLTRTLPASVTGPRLAAQAFAALVPAGALLQAAQGHPLVAPSPLVWGGLGACVAIGAAAYLAIVAATRAGDIAVVSSFRYTRMLFALVLAALLFGERPDAATLVGVAVVIGAGLYTLLREARLRRMAGGAGVGGAS